jgi:hypothetical protein
MLLEMDFDELKERFLKFKEEKNEDKTKQ